LSTGTSSSALTKSILQYDNSNIINEHHDEKLMKSGVSHGDFKSWCFAALNVNTVTFFFFFCTFVVKPFCFVSAFYYFYEYLTYQLSFSFLSAMLFNEN
jgi:hypothetical protein